MFYVEENKLTSIKQEEEEWQIYKGSPILYVFVLVRRLEWLLTYVEPHVCVSGWCRWLSNNSLQQNGGSWDLFYITVHYIINIRWRQPPSSSIHGHHPTCPVSRDTLPGQAQSSLACSGRTGSTPPEPCLRSVKQNQPTLSPDIRWEEVEVRSAATLYLSGLLCFAQLRHNNQGKR